ncbi:MAG: hypothetical protein QXV75_08175 [Candidatus Bathyarchaeia archaeon]
MVNVEMVKVELERAGFDWSDVLKGFYDWLDVFLASPTLWNEAVQEAVNLLEDARKDIKNYMRGEFLEVRIDCRRLARNLLASGI